MLHIANYSEFELYLPDKNFETTCQQNWTSFTCLTPVEQKKKKKKKIDLWPFLQ